MKNDLVFVLFLAVILEELLSEDTLDWLVMLAASFDCISVPLSWSSFLSDLPEQVVTPDEQYEQAVKKEA